MNLRSQARAFLIQAASLVRADALALYLQRLKRRPYGLVVAMHETPISLEAQFRDQLRSASQYFTITNLEGFAKLWEHRRDDMASAKPPILFTFDDGRESNYAVAAPLLESFGGRGVFFVVPAFAESATTDQALSFYRTRINPDSKPGDEKWEDWKPMNPAQIAELADRGHAIGNHTLTHERLIGLSPETLELETMADGAAALGSVDAAVDRVDERQSLIAITPVEHHLEEGRVTQGAFGLDCGAEQGIFPREQAILFREIGNLGGLQGKHVKLVEPSF